MYKHKLDVISLKRKHLESENRRTESSDPRHYQIQAELDLLDLEDRAIWKKISTFKKVNSIIIQTLSIFCIMYCLIMFGFMIFKCVTDPNGNAKVQTSHFFDEYPVLLYTVLFSLIFFPIYSFCYKMIFKFFFGDYGGNPENH